MTEKDFIVGMEGSLCTITPMTGEARAWLERSCQWESWQIVGGSYVADRRMAEPIISGLREVGFSMEEEQ